MGIFDKRESAVRSYRHDWPVVFDRANGSRLYDEEGHAYLDFFRSAGAVNYGHNNPALKRPLIEYVTSDKITHSLDMYTLAKCEFLAALDELIPGPRQLDYRVQFSGPGGASFKVAGIKPQDETLQQATLAKGQRTAPALTALARSVPGTEICARGRGLAHGPAHEPCASQSKIWHKAFAH